MADQVATKMQAQCLKLKSSDAEPGYLAGIKPAKPIGQKIKTASLAFGLSLAGLTLTAALPAQAASLGDLFGSAEVESGQQKFLKVEQAFSVKPSQSGNKITIALNITPKHYLYKDKLGLKLPEGVSASAIKFSHVPQSIDDPTFGKVQVFKQPQVTATATLTNTTAAAINDDVIVTWQGCADAGLCYPPQKEILSINLPPTVAAKAAPKVDKVAIEPAQSSKVPATTKAQITPQVAQAAAATSAAVAASSAPNNQVQAEATPPDQLAGSQSDPSELKDGSLMNTDLVDPATDKAVAEDESLTYSAAASAEGSANADANTTNVSAALVGDGVVDQDPFGLSEHPWLALGLLFLAGLGLAFTPCVLPMLPIVSNIVARQHKPTAKKGLMLSGSYALGVAVAYGILGAIIAIFGQQLGIIGWLQNPVILLGFAAVFVLLALYMLDVISFSLPSVLRQKTQTLSQSGDKYLGSSTGSFIAGLLSALVVSPCVSAPLFGALLAVSTIGNPLLGFAALFMLGFGLSAPLMLLGISQGNLMPKAGEWMNWVKQGFALLLFAVALLLVERVIIHPGMLLLWALWFMVVATWAWSWHGRGELLTKPLALLFGLWAGVTLVGAAAGSNDAWQPLKVLSQKTPMPVMATVQTQSAAADGGYGVPAAAQSIKDVHINSLDALIPLVQNNPKVLVDVTAEWCIECRIMDKTLFTNRPAAMQQWQLVRLDVTESNAESARILSELKLFGPPALLYFVDGKLQVQQVGTIERDEFEQTLAKL